MHKRIFILLLFSTLCFGQGLAPKSAFSVPSSQDSWFGKDKAMHCIGSFLLTGYASYYLKTEEHYSPNHSRNSAVAITVSMGLGKEMRDLFSSKGQFSLKDMAADGLGVGLALLLVEWW